MSAAQVAISVLIGVLIAGSVVLFVDGDHDVAAWVMAGFGLFGYLSLLGMIATDRNPRRR